MKGAGWTQLVHSIDDPLERALLGKYKLAYQRGKGNRHLVPLLIPVDCIEAIRKLISLRDDVGVSRQNPYLFPRTQGSCDCTSGWESIHEVCRAAGITSVGNITATRMRHRASTMYALQDAPEHERAAFYCHMGT